MAKDKDYRRLIGSVEWQKVRREAMIRASCMCERCKENGLSIPASEAHHVVPVETATTFEEKKRLMYDVNNVRCLCHDCHVMIHFEMGRSGKKQNKARQHERAQKVIEKFFS